MNYFEGDNIGSLLKAEIAFHSDFDSFNPAVLAAGKSWVTIPFTEESGSLYFKINDTANGLVYQYSGKVSIHNLRDEVENDLYPFLGQIAVLRLTDMNERVYIIGAPGTPVTCEATGGTGDRFTSLNGQDLLFKIEQAHAAFRL